jgi:hypothetical protein
MRKAFNWLVKSSVYPKQTSLFIKGLGATIVSYVLFFSGIVHIPLNESDLNQVVELIATIVEVILTLVSMFVALKGFIRKIALTVTGKNAVLNQ